MNGFQGWATVPATAPLEAQVMDHVRTGWQVVYDDGTQVIVVKEAGKMSAVAHLVCLLVTLCTFGLFGLVWVIIAIVDSRKAEQRKTLRQPAPEQRQVPPVILP